MQQVVGQYLSKLLQLLGRKCAPLACVASVAGSPYGMCGEVALVLLDPTYWPVSPDMLSTSTRARARQCFQLRLGVAGFRIDAAKHMDAGACALIRGRRF